MAFAPAAATRDVPGNEIGEGSEPNHYGRVVRLWRGVLGLKRDGSTVISRNTVKMVYDHSRTELKDNQNVLPRYRRIVLRDVAETYA